MSTVATMETMQWSEISTASSSSTSLGVVNGIGGAEHHRNMQGAGGPNVTGHGSSENGPGGTLGAPTIKNHSVTYFNDFLYCFGGYDGRRNHNLLLLYNIKEHRWIRPQTVQEDGFNNARNNIQSDSSNGSTIRVDQERANSTGNSADRIRVASFKVGDEDDNNVDGIENDDEIDGNTNEDDSANGDRNRDVTEQNNQSQEVQNHNQPIPQQHLGTFRDDPYSRINHDTFYSGTGGNIEHRNNNSYAYTVTGNPPPGRNGHSATLATDEDDENDEERGEVTGRIIVLGGWLGQGPLAASDMHVLDISRGGRKLRWYQPAVKGTPPGPCNMHSADYVKARKEVFVFRGGNGTF